MHSQSHLLVITADLPTLQPRVDNPQSCRGGDHNRSERGGGLIHGRKTAREALEKKSGTSPNLQANRQADRRNIKDLDTFHGRVPVMSRKQWGADLGPCVDWVLIR
jgi:hypothetical protein